MSWILRILQINTPEQIKNNKTDIFFKGVINCVLWYNYYTISKLSFDVELVDVFEGFEAKSFILFLVCFV